MTTRNHLNQIGDIHGHFIDLSTVILFNVPQNTNILIRNEVNSYTLTSKTSRTTNSTSNITPSRLPMNVQFTTIGKIVIDDQRNLLHIQTTTPYIRSN